MIRHWGPPAAAVLASLGCAGGTYRSVPLAMGTEASGRYTAAEETEAALAPTSWPQIARSLASATDPNEAIGAEIAGHKREIAKLKVARAALGSRTKNTGWRMGMLYVTGHAIDELNRELGKEGVSPLRPWLTAWGYQFEILRGRYGEANGLWTVVPLIVGLEQSVVIPAVNVLGGLRFANGWEFGGGAHYTPGMELAEGEMIVPGLGLAVGVGYAFRAGPEGQMRIPVNLTVVLSRDSPTYSITLGWTLPRE